MGACCSGRRRTAEDSKARGDPLLPSHPPGRGCEGRHLSPSELSSACAESVAFAWNTLSCLTTELCSARRWSLGAGA